jgi:hypothetical protein
MPMSEPFVDSFAARNWLDSPEGQKRVMTLQIICFALISGVLPLLVVFAVISPFREIDGTPNWVFVGVAGAIFLTSTAASLFVGAFLPNQIGADPVSLANNAQTQWIIAYALMEGPAFLCLVLSLAVPSNIEKGILMGMVIGLLLFMILRFPTRNRFLSAMGASD